MSHFENFKKEILDAYDAIPRQEPKFVITKGWLPTDLQVRPKIQFGEYTLNYINKTNTKFKSFLYNAINGSHKGNIFVPWTQENRDLLAYMALTHVAEYLLRLVRKNLRRKAINELEGLISISKLQSCPKLAEGIIILYNYQENNHSPETIHNIAETLKLMSNKYGSR